MLEAIAYAVFGSDIMIPSLQFTHAFCTFAYHISV